jgi:hypothetical protein
VAGDWDEADRLRGEIEAAGWRVTDRGPDFALAPASPPDIVDRGVVRYGSSASAPSRLGEAPTAPATVIVRVSDQDPRALLGSLQANLAAATHVVIVADDPAPGAAATLAGGRGSGHLDVEIIWTSARLGPAASLNLGLRRSRGDTVVVLGPTTELRGDPLPRVLPALASTEVAVAGADGLAGSDVRNLRPAPPGQVVALDGRCVAVHRGLAAARGPIDERLATWRLLATWWTLVLRDRGAGQPPLQAIALGDLPIADCEAVPADVAAADRDRLVRRDRYRLLDRFGSRPDLLVAGSS